MESRWLFLRFNPSATNSNSPLVSVQVVGLLVNRGVGVVAGGSCCSGPDRVDREESALSTDEHVHHITGVKTDNRLENLELWSTSHPSGQRIKDLLEFCMAMLDRYSGEFWLIDREQGPSKRLLSHVHKTI